MLLIPTGRSLSVIFFQFVSAHWADCVFFKSFEKLSLLLVRFFTILSPILILAATAGQSFGGNALILTLTTTNITCNGQINGTITSALTGETGGTVNFTLNPGSVSNADGVFNNLSAGIYTVSADDNGNIITATTTVTEPPVTDTTPPIISCTPLTVANPSSIPASNLNTGITASDNCGSVTIELVEENYVGMNNAAGFCPSSVERTYVAMDQSGNFSSPCKQIITVQSAGTCKICQDDVPFIPVIFSRADETYTSPSVARNGVCCNASGPPPPKCISFNIYLHKDAVGLIFKIVAGAIPPGALYYQIDCGPPQKVGEVLCLQGGRFYTLTFCKPGNNENIYAIQSISGMTSTEGLVTRADNKCSGQISVTGIVPSTISWSVKTPNDQSLLHYLSCTNCLTPIFTPDSLAPAAIVYQVCGTLNGTAVCDGNPIVECKDVTITVLPAIKIAFNIDPGNICQNNIPVIHAEVSPANLNYSYKWYAGSNGSGAVLSADPFWTPSSEGFYSLIATESQSGVICNTATNNFQIKFDKLGPVVMAPPDTLKIECDDPAAETKIAAWIAAAKASDGNISSIVVNNDYVPFARSCSLNASVRFWASDACGNISEVTGTIKVTDNVKPTITCSANVTQTALPGNCSLDNVIITDPTYADNCSVTTLTWTMSGATTGSSLPTGINSASGKTYNVGITTVTYTASDAAGNKASCTFNVWIKDLLKPIMTSGCPVDMVQTTDPGQCTAFVTVPKPLVSDPCNEGFSIINNLNNTDNASGTYPAGSTIVVWTITDLSGNVTTCSQKITINDRNPTLACPSNLDVMADFEKMYASDVSVPSPTFGDDCPGIILTWTMTGVNTGSSPAAGVNIFPATYTFNVGVSTIQYNLEDANGHKVSCSFMVTVEAKPDIKCQPDTTKNGISGTCMASLDPGFPIKVAGAEPITYTWTMSGASSGSGTGPIVPIPFSFNVGVTTITWTATNISGSDACTQTITISDSEIPTINPPAPMNFCVENLISAAIVSNLMQLSPTPDYYLFKKGSTVLDINPADMSDNCTPSNQLTLYWKIDFSVSTPTPSISGTGQPSAYTSDIIFPGDGSTFKDVIHTMTYWVVDQSGNESVHKSVTITIHPRPVVSYHDMPELNNINITNTKTFRNKNII